MNKHQLGFTLIELLVVVSIIALLASIVLASLMNTRDKAKDAAAISELMQIRNAMEIHLNEFGEYPLPSNLTNGGNLPNSLIPVLTSKSLYAGAPNFLDGLYIRKCVKPTICVAPAGVYDDELLRNLCGTVSLIDQTPKAEAAIMFTLKKGLDPRYSHWFTLNVLCFYTDR